MRIDGTWHLCDDDVLRPVIHGEIQAADGSWIKCPLLVDIAADRTVVSADIWAIVAFDPIASPHPLSGVGGQAPSVVFNSEVRLTHDAGGKVSFRGQFAAITELESLDMSVLGRDITNLFAVIVDRPGALVCLLGQRHHYIIEER